jgi:hypothetical protein
MNFLRHCIFIVLLVLSVDGSWAETHSAAQLEALKKRVANYELALVKSDVDGIFDVIPPKIVEDSKAVLNASDEQIKEYLRSNLKLSEGKAAILEVQFHISKADTQALADGTSYLLLPTVTKTQIQNTGEISRVMMTTTTTLAFVERGNWYLLDISQQPIIATLHKVYPEFRNLSQAALNDQFIEEKP